MVAHIEHIVYRGNVSFAIASAKKNFSIYRKPHL